MVVATRLLLLLAVAGVALAQQRSLSSSTRRRNRLPAGKSEVLDFSCPEDFGYYQHPTDCTQYYVCVFGGALQESCSGGLVYSHDLQTCDWPRNVVCNVDLAAPVSTVRVTDPRTAEPPRQRGQGQSLTPSVSSNGFSENFRSSAGRSKDQLSGPSSSAVNRQGRIIQGQRDVQQQQPIRGRFQVQESTNRAFSVSPTTSRTFSFPPALPGSSSSPSQPSPPSPPSPGLEPRPISSPFSRGSQQSQSVTPAPVELEPNFYSDLLNLTDDEYFYLYDDLLLEDYFDATATTTTPRSVTRAPIRDRERFTSIREKEGATATRSQSSFSHPSISQTRGNSITTEEKTSFPQTQTFPETRSSSSSVTSSSSRSSSSSSLARGKPASQKTSSLSQTRSSSIPSASSSNTPSNSIASEVRPNRGPPRGQSRASSSSSSSSSRTQTKSPAPSRGRVSTDSSRPARLTVKPVSEHLKNSNHLITNVWKYPPRRPAALYPTPPVNSKATKCDRKVCRLPDCSCGGKEVPNGIAPQDVPQMVLLTFDDSVNDLNKELYQELFERGRTNPNGCPLAATFYVSHEWTDYSQVQNLYADGHEIASHSITHSFGEQFSKQKWAKEIAGQREIMSAYGGVNMEDIRGMRAPFLAVGGNKMFEMLHEQNFTYDSSMPVYENRPPSYPYTLDYKLFHDCMIPPCPTNSFPGLWEVPMVMWQDLNGGRCSMGDACTTPPDAEGVYKMLIKNFERHYTTNRAPMGLFYHAAWFTTAHHKEGFIAFLDTISGMPDVWLVTNWQALQWVRDPVPISQANNFKPFQCNYPERPARCKSHKVCNVWHKGGVRYMRTCQRCPEAYPWVGATGVQSPLND